MITYQNRSIFCLLEFSNIKCELNIAIPKKQQLKKRERRRERREKEERKKRERDTLNRVFHEPWSG